MKDLYIYTRFLADGRIQVLLPRPKMTLEELQKEVGGSIQLLPSVYYEDQKWGKVTVYCNENGRLDGLPLNPHFKVLEVGFELVGNILKEEKYGH